MPIASIINLVLTGALAGLIAGFMGLGGGVVLTPLCLLIYPALGIGSHELVKIIFGTNMFLVMAFSISAVSKHHKNSKIDWRTVLIMGPLAIIGSAAGGWLASNANSSDLKKAFAVLLVFSSIAIITKGLKIKDSPPGGRKPLLPMKLLPLLGMAAGFIGSLLGIGGGAVMIPSLILLFAYPVDRVAATSSSVIVFIGFSGMLTYMWNGRGMVDLPGLSVGYVWLSAAVPLMIGGVPMARFGAWLNAKIHTRILQRLFGILTLIIAIRIMFFS
ncbi:hypothetical protein ES708_04452 [subsurface metagenome]